MVGEVSIHPPAPPRDPGGRYARRPRRATRGGTSVDLQDGQKRFLGDVHAPDPLHALLPFLLLLEQLALARDVAAVALREDVLAHRLDGLAAEDLAPDGRLDDDLEQLPGNELLHLRGQSAPFGLRLL